MFRRWRIRLRINCWPVRATTGRLRFGRCRRGRCDIRSRGIAALSDAGKTSAAGLRYGSIKVWKVKDWTELPGVRGLAGDVWSLAFTGKGELVSGSGDWNLPGQVTVWDVESGKQMKQFNIS